MKHVGVSTASTVCTQVQLPCATLHLSPKISQDELAKTVPIVKSPAISRLLAVDSDNYMLHKGAASANGVSHDQQQQINGSAILIAGGTYADPDGVAIVQLATSGNLEYQWRNQHATINNINNNNNNNNNNNVIEASSELAPTAKHQAQTAALAATAGLPNGVECAKKNIVRCARIASFHRLLCWCDVDETSAPVSLDNNNGYTNKKNLSNGVVDKLTCENGVNKVDDEKSVNTRENFEKYNSKNIINNGAQCCCMCGSVCPTECHACFHTVCSDYAGQQPCQWSKGHAGRGQVYETEKVSNQNFFISPLKSSKFPI